MLCWVSHILVRLVASNFSRDPWHLESSLSCSMMSLFWRSSQRYLSGVRQLRQFRVLAALWRLFISKQGFLNGLKITFKKKGNTYLEGPWKRKSGSRLGQTPTNGWYVGNEKIMVASSPPFFKDFVSLSPFFMWSIFNFGLSLFFTAQ